MQRPAQDYIQDVRGGNQMAREVWLHGGSRKLLELDLHYGATDGWFPKEGAGGPEQAATQQDAAHPRVSVAH